MRTPAQTKANSSYVQRKRAEGFRQVTIWLSARARKVLCDLTDVLGSRDQAAEAAFLRYLDQPMRAAEKPVEAVSAPKATRTARKPAKPLTADPGPIAGSSGYDVQVGPVVQKPGSRLKVRK